MERRGELALTYLSHSDHPTHSSIFRRSPGTTTSAGLRALRDWLEGGKDGGIAAGTQDLQSSHEENWPQTIKMKTLLIIGIFRTLIKYSLLLILSTLHQLLFRCRSRFSFRPALIDQEDGRCVTRGWTVCRWPYLVRLSCPGCGGEEGSKKLIFCRHGDGNTEFTRGQRLPSRCSVLLDNLKHNSGKNIFMPWNRITEDCATHDSRCANWSADCKSNCN